MGWHHGNTKCNLKTWYTIKSNKKNLLCTGVTLMISFMFVICVDAYMYSRM